MQEFLGYDPEEGSFYFSSNEDGTRIFRVKNGKNEFVDYDVTGNKTARFETSIGRIIFNRQCLPEDYEFMNYKMVKGDVAKLVADCCDRYPEAKVGPILDLCSDREESLRRSGTRHDG